MTPAQGRGHLAMLAFSALIAGSFSLGALAAPLISPFALTAVRFVLAAALVGAAAALGPGLGRAALAAPWRYGVLGSLLAIYFVLMFQGLKTAAPVAAAAVFTLTPAISAGFGWLLLRQRLTPRIALALALGGLGALWVIFRGEVAALLSLQVGKGEAIYFAGCVAHALYTPMVRRLNRGEPAVVFTFFTMCAGAVLLVLTGWRDIVATDWAALPAVVWVTLVYIAVAASAASFVLLQFSSLRLPAAKVMAYTYLVPAWVIGWEIALHGTMPPAAALVGVGLTLVALALLLRDDG